MVSDKNIFEADQIHAILIPLFSKLGWKSSWIIKYFYTVIVSMENMSKVFEDSYWLKIDLVMSPE